MVLIHLEVLPLVCQVPLSCVPPCRILTLNGLTDRLMNWRVESPLFMLSSLVGTRERSCWQRSRRAGLRPRESHQEETSANSPLERMMPPSLDSKNWYGLF